MAVVGVARERPDSPSATLELNKMSFVRKFLVQTNNKNDGPVTVCSAVGIPRPFQIYSTPNEFQRYARCRSVDAQRIEPASLYWEVTCHYSTPEPYGLTEGSKTEKDGQNDNPLLMIPEIETHMERYEQAVYWVYNPTPIVINTTGATTLDSQTITNIGDVTKIVEGMTITGAGISAGVIVITVDLTDNTVLMSDGATATGAGVALTFTGSSTIQPVQATSGEVFDPPPMKDASRLILSITRNEDITAPHPLTGLLFSDTINSDRFFGAAPGQVKCMGVTAAKQTKQLSNGAIFAYLKCVYTFQFRPTWNIQILNAGNWYWREAGKLNKDTFKAKDGHPIQGLLDKDGLKLADGETPLFVGFQAYPAQKFNTLNLPNSFLAAS